MSKLRQITGAIASMLRLRGERPDWLVIRRPGSPILFFICMLTILAVAIPIAHSSCVYNQRTRVGLNAAAAYFQHRAAAAQTRAQFEAPRLASLDLKAAAAARRAASQLRVNRLSCSLPFPPVR